jgi:hypothetical protein
MRGGDISVIPCRVRSLLTAPYLDLLGLEDLIGLYLEPGDSFPGGSSPNEFLGKAH